ncbi:MAG: 1-acyl-sn-glycerol-3-phosphate acyltransferase [Oscillospiraceae bacterium]|nr:1-acyl-sn-glycerol-3-phosphate acyltransferase [Oscillospiraceae bacterium]
MVIGIIAIAAAVISALICGCSGSFESLAWLWVLPAGWLGIFLGILLLAFLLILLMCAAVDIEKEEKKDNRLYRFVTYMIADAAHTVLQVRVKSEGVEKIPGHGRVLLVCNHLSNADPVIIFHQVKKRQKLAFIAKREAGKMFVVGKLMHKMLCQRINRENDREALKTILKCIDIIKQDEASIAVFPEGGIKGGNVLHPFRNGVFKIALRTKVPVVVCTLWGTQDVFHNGLRLKHSDVWFHVLDVIQPETYAGMTAVELGHLVHDMMAKDLGPERVLFVEENP